MMVYGRSKGNLVTYWSFPQLSTSLQTYTDLCLFYSAVQCTVLSERSYREMDMYFLTVAVRRL